MNGQARPAPEMAESGRELEHRAMLGSLLGPRFALSVRAARLCDDRLFPDERAFVAHAVPKRRAEWGTARLCAREALAELGIAAGSLLPNPDRSPRWPEGVRGSISHGADICAVAVTRSRTVAAVGVDVENDRGLDEGLEEVVCTPAERAWLARRPVADRRLLGKVFFSAKEAFYKCQYVMSSTVLDFLDVELELDADRSVFSIARICSIESSRSVAAEIVGRYARSGGLIMSTVVLEG